MLVQRGGRIYSVLEVCSFLAARFCYCYIIFYYGWAKPLLIVLLSKITRGGCDAMILAAAQANSGQFGFLVFVLDVCLC